MRCIFVDDELHAVETMTRLVVGKVNIQLTTLMNNPLEILKEAKSSNQIDVAVIDICMEGLDGIDLAKQLIEIRPHVKIILITGYGREQVYKRAEDLLGDNLYKILNKPYNPKSMLALLDEISEKFVSENRKITIKTHNGFDIFLNGEVLKFSCKKSKELLAVLVDAHGLQVTRDTSIGKLWQDVALKSSGKSYDHAKQELRKTLKSYGIEDILQYQRGSMNIVTKEVEVDSWEILKRGEQINRELYMIYYDWN